jgi:hypothetical protein
MARPVSLLLALVPLLGLTELGLHSYFARRAPGCEQSAALGPQLEKLKQPGVPVVVAPSWAEPLVRQAAPKAFPVAELTRPDDSGFRQFIEVSLLGAQSEALAAFAVKSEEQVGPFKLSLRDNPHATPPEFDFVTAVEVGQVEVFTQRGQERSLCERVERSRPATGGLHGPVTRPRQRHECGGSIVGVTLIEDERYRPHRCILVEPTDDGDVVLRFSSVPKSDVLFGYTGFSYFRARDFTGTSVELRFTDGAEALGERQVVSNGTWNGLSVKRAAAQGAVEVAVKRRSPEPADFCFALEAR